MFKFFYLFTGIYTSTNFESINTTEFVISNMNNLYNTKNKNQYNQIPKGKNNTKRFLEQENLELTNIIENALDLEEELRYKNIQSSDLNNHTFDTTNFQYFKDDKNVTNSETLENPVLKKLKMDNNNKCITSENSKHWQENFQNNASIYNSSASNCFEFQKQCDAVLNSNKTIGDKKEKKNNERKRKEVIIHKDKRVLLNNFYDAYIEKFNIYIISRRNLNWNSITQKEMVESNNQKLTNFDLFIDFCKDVLNHFKSAFDKVKKEPILIFKQTFLFKNKNKKITCKFMGLKNVYRCRRHYFIKNIQIQIKNIEESSFIKESSCESIKELIVECVIFIKEVVGYFSIFNLSVHFYECNINLIYNECKDIIQRFTNISRAVELKYILVIIKMLIERLETSAEFLKIEKKNFLLLFKSVTYLSTDIDWFISPLKDIIDGIDKKYKRRELN